MVFSVTRVVVFGSVADKKRVEWPNRLLEPANTMLFPHLLRKAILVMTTSTNEQDPRPRLKAAIIGLGLDGPFQPVRILRSQELMVVGGSDSTRSDMLETMLRLEGELERIGRGLGDVEPEELAEIAWRIDWPELEEIAVRMALGLAEKGQSFQTATAQELTLLASASAS